MSKSIVTSYTLLSNPEAGGLGKTIVIVDRTYSDGNDRTKSYTNLSVSTCERINHLVVTRNRNNLDVSCAVFIDSLGAGLFNMSKEAKA